MSKVLYVMKRHGGVDAADTDRLDLVAERLVPDNLAAERVVHDKRIAGQLAILIVNDRGSFTRVGNSLLCGRALTRGNAWSRPGGPLPSGDYALFREAPACLELATNSVGSRTLWYYLDDHYFLAATSQRAIVLFLGDFRFDPDVVPWMLSSGSLGPALAWDSRIPRLREALSGQAPLDHHAALRDAGLPGRGRSAMAQAPTQRAYRGLRDLPHGRPGRLDAAALRRLRQPGHPLLPGSHHARCRPDPHPDLGCAV